MKLSVFLANLLKAIIFRFDFSIPLTLHLKNEAMKGKRAFIRFMSHFTESNSCEHEPHLHFLQRLQ